MKRVYTADSIAMAWHIRNVLEQHDIASTVRNDKLYSVAGELPVTECLPEVWVSHNQDAERAEQIVLDLNFNEEELPDWKCTACSEDNAGNFTICWNCQNSKNKEE
ncbi:MAG: DUF2007 domain-containing protein [Gammaproteobacteria bacterium]|jgi:hypothetical protein|nr:DUF2007 domain-containing protein [Gammaproteobacteria bacterium]HAJ75549.1 hypothetical protein [Gammaproteobacteria bacterium]